MKYLKRFETHADYEDYAEGEGAITPFVIACDDSEDVHYMEEKIMYKVTCVYNFAKKNEHGQ